MKTPRNVSAAQLIKKLRFFGYNVARQEGSHVQLTTEQSGQHHITVPHHSPIKIGTLTNILKAIAVHHELSVKEVIHRLSL